MIDCWMKILFEMSSGCVKMVSSLASRLSRGGVIED